MRIHSLPIPEAVGHILVHNIANASGQKVLKKGTVLRSEDVATLAGLGHTRVDVAVLEQGDVPEDVAAARIGEALQRDNPYLRTTRAVTGRVNLHATNDGVLFVDANRLAALNSIRGVALATRPAYSVLGPSFATTQIATLKIIPYALGKNEVEEAAQHAAGMIEFRALSPHRVALLVTADEGSRDRIQRQFETPTRERLERLGSTLTTVTTVTQQEETITVAVQQLLATHEALIIGGQTSVMDIEDITPRALKRSGADVVLHGAPVEPGNLLALAYRNNKWILCAPGCAKSPKANVVDLVLPRLLTGERLGQAEVAMLGLGGLLD